MGKKMTVRMQFRGLVPPDEIKNLRRCMNIESIESIGENTIIFVAEASTALREWLDGTIYGLTKGDEPNTIFIQALDGPNHDQQGCT